MKALILAAGSGTRMGKYTENLPKGMLNVMGETLIERQLKTLRRAGIDDIAIATGYKSEKIQYTGVRYYHNADYATTNMLETIMSTKEFLKEGDDVLIAYSDILYTPELVGQCVSFDCDVGVAVDRDWKKLWMLRYGTTEFDLESLSVDASGTIRELGREVASSEGLDYRYIGLIRFSSKGLETMFDVYNARQGKAWSQSGKEFKKGYMTDMLYEINRSGTPVKAIVTSGNWLEFDTSEDYERLSEAMKNGTISESLQIRQA